MKVLIQRSKGAKVFVSNELVGSIESGMVVFLGITHSDSEKDIDFLVQKIIHLKIFPGENGEFDSSLLDSEKEILLVSQFTLYANCKKGRRPNFNEAAKADFSESLYKKFVQKLEENNIKVSTGSFGANMQVELTNDGPVTLIVESPIDLNKK